MKVLLFSNDLMPFPGLPTSGGGLRAWQLYQGLFSRGVEVVVSMPGFTFLAKRYEEKISAELRAHFWDYGTQERLISQEKPDAILYTSNWDHVQLTRKPKVPLIIDLHGSRLIETALFGDPQSGERKVEVLALADCLLAAGKRQRLYFSGWLLQAGRVPEAEHFIRYIPVSLDPKLPLRRTAEAAETPLLVSGGGWFPWQNQAKAIFLLAQKIRAEQRGVLEIYGTPHQGLSGSAEMDRISAIYREICQLAKDNERIRVKGYVSREELLTRYLEAHVALEAMSYNLERELAFTTRTIEYLWCGLPVIYNNYAELSEHISEYDAGWCVSADDENALEAVYSEIFSSPKLLKKKSKNARRLVRERFLWDKTIEPLLDFLEKPRQAPKLNPLRAQTHSRPAYLHLSGEPDLLSLGSDATELQQHFVFLAEDISQIELNVVGVDKELKNFVSALRLILCDSNERVLAQRDVPQERIKAGAMLKLKLPRYRRPTGGDELSLKLRLLLRPGAIGHKGLVTFRAYRGSDYPFIGGAKLLKYNQVKESSSSLGLSFLPGELSRVFRAKVLLRRGIHLLSEGDYKRFMRAIRYRLAAQFVQLRRGRQ